MTRQAVARWPLALMCAVALWVLTALPAYAHASLLDTDPAEGARLDVTPREVTFTFSEPVSVLPDAVTLLTHDEPARTMTATSVGAVVTVTLPDLAPDQRYSVAWRVVSADGHPVSGMLTFSVGDPPAGTPALQPEATQQPVVEVAYIVWTAVWYAVVLLTAGLLVFQLVCVRRGARQVPTQLLHAAAIAGGLAVLTLLALQAARLAGPRGTPSLTLIGWPPIAAAAATVGGLTVAWFLARRGQLRGPVVAVAVAAASPILVGHSAAVAPRWLMLTAGLVLAIMVIPFITSVMREVFLTVPTRLKESAYALGSTKWEVSWDIVLPYTRSAVIGGIFLGLGRALGETMAVAFVVGNSVRLSPSLLEPGTTIAALIANDFGEATETYRSALLLLGFVLFVVTFIVLAIARLMLMRLSRKEGN